MAASSLTSGRWSDMGTGQSRDTVVNTLPAHPRNLHCLHAELLLVQLLLQLLLQQLVAKSLSLTCSNNIPEHKDNTIELNLRSELCHLI